MGHAGLTDLCAPLGSASARVRAQRCAPSRERVRAWDVHIKTPKCEDVFAAHVEASSAALDSGRLGASPHAVAIPHLASARQSHHRPRRPPDRPYEDTPRPSCGPEPGGREVDRYGERGRLAGGLPLPLVNICNIVILLFFIGRCCHKTRCFMYLPLQLECLTYVNAYKAKH